MPAAHTWPAAANGCGRTAAVRRIVRFVSAQRPGRPRTAGTGRIGGRAISAPMRPPSTAHGRGTPRWRMRAAVVGVDVESRSRAVAAGLRARTDDTHAPRDLQPGIAPARSPPRFAGRLSIDMPIAARERRRGRALHALIDVPTAPPPQSSPTMRTTPEGTASSESSRSLRSVATGCRASTVSPHLVQRSTKFSDGDGAGRKSTECCVGLAGSIQTSRSPWMNGAGSNQTDAL